MKIKIFKTISKQLGYLSFNLLPVIGFEGFRFGDKTIYIAWLIWSIQIKWNSNFS